LYEKAAAWRDTLERHKGEVLLYEGGDQERPYYLNDEYLSQISEEAQEFLETHGERAASAFFKVARGEGTLLSSQVDTWLAEQSGTITAQTSAQHRTVIRAFTAWAGSGVLIEDVTQRYAGGGYSKGERVRLRDIINKLRYAPAVMRLIRTPTKEDHTRTTTEKE
jgi:hypothetical protein